MMAKPRCLTVAGVPTLSGGKRRWRIGVLLAWAAPVIACVAFALCQGAPANAADPSVKPPTPQEIIDAFKERVFFGTQEKTLIKWALPVRVGLLSDNGISPAWVKVIADDVDKVQRATQHDVVYASDHINFLIAVLRDPEAELQRHSAQLAPFFAGDADFQAYLAALRNPLVVCKNKFQAINQRRELIYLVVVKTGAPYDDSLSQGCLLSQIIEGLGVIRRTAKISNIGSDERRFTTMDEILLRLLYDRRIASGMTEAQAMPIISHIVNTEFGN